MKCINKMVLCFFVIGVCYFDQSYSAREHWYSSEEEANFHTNLANLGPQAVVALGNLNKTGGVQEKSTHYKEPEQHDFSKVLKHREEVKPKKTDARAVEQQDYRNVLKPAKGKTNDHKVIEANAGATNFPNVKLRRTATNVHKQTVNQQENGKIDFGVKLRHVAK